MARGFSHYDAESSPHYSGFLSPLPNILFSMRHPKGFSKRAAGHIKRTLAHRTFLISVPSVLRCIRLATDFRLTDNHPDSPISMMSDIPDMPGGSYYFQGPGGTDVWSDEPRRHDGPTDVDMDGGGPVYTPQEQFAPQANIDGGGPTGPVYTPQEQPATQGSNVGMGGTRTNFDTGGDATAVWAGQEGPRPNEERERAHYARETAKAALREKKEAEAKLAEMEKELTRVKALVTSVVETRDLVLEDRDRAWTAHFEKFTEKFTKEKNDQYNAFIEQQQFNAQRVKEVDAQIAAKDEEQKQKLAEAEAKHRREQEKIQTDYETKLAAFHARQSNQRGGARGTQNDDMEDIRFPHAPPTRPPQFVPAATREERAVEAVIRNGYGRFSVISMSAPTPPDPSAAPQTTATAGQTTSQAPPLINLSDPKFVEALLKAVGLGKTVRRSRKKAPGAMTVMTEARKAQQAKMDPRADLLWKALVRELLRMLTGCTTFVEFKDYKPVDAATAGRCEEGEEEPNEFRFFLGLVGRIRYGLPDVDNSYLLALFHNYLKEARGEWSRYRARPGETSEQARERAEGYGEKRQKRLVHHSRKQHKFDSRMVTTDRMIKVCAAMSQYDGAAAWQWLKEEILRELDVAGMSSEEDEPAEVVCGDQRIVVTTHKIRKCAWRPTKIGGYMEIIDDATERAKTKTAQKRIRQRTGENSKTAAPLRLARYLYDETWLSQQKKYIPDIEEQLMIKEKEVEMREFTVYNPPN
ncbi:hypothetical protein B0H10DRAFT_2232896 [Mycena sp. CBHHK59/15]|nr:hypothetical protein B0H10DRAFT_2232896 [Mycena sp. CBHHK59/15]